MSISSTTPSFKVGLTPDEKKLYAQLFKSLDPESTGIITGEKARTTFEKSGLPPAILGEIWQIADQNNLGFLTQFGFCTAMRLIGYTQAGNHPTPQLADYPGPLPKFVNLSLNPPPLAPPNALQPQSTSNSFMQTQPSAAIPSNTTTNQYIPQDPISKITPADYQKFSQLFIKTTGSPTNDLNGAKAKDIFLKAKLPTTTLSQIWSLVDKDNSGYLNLGGFVIAMHLIQGLLSGTIKQLPPFLPESIWQSVQQPETPSGSRQVSHASVNSQQTTINHPPAPTTAQSPTQRNFSSTSLDSGWSVTPAQKQQYDSIFTNLDKSNSGQLNPDQVAGFLMTSKLNQQDLANVWDLSDIQNTGIFTKLEFAIALFLVNKRLSGEALPNIVPDTLVDSIKQLESTQGQAPQNQPIPPQHSSTQQFQQSAPQPQLAPPQPQQQQQQQQRSLQAPAPPPVPRQTSALDELADIFGSSSDVGSSADQKQPANNSPLPEQNSGNRNLQSRTSSSDLSPSGNLPKARSNLTGSFKPTSTFGQSLMQKQPLQSPREDEGESLIGDDVSHEQTNSHVPATNHVNASHPAPVAETPTEERKAINYDALRAVPPPPAKKVATNSAPTADFPVEQQTQVPNTSSGPAPIPAPRGQDREFSGYSQHESNDLLADKSEISGQLSQATSDIANISNQVKSLTSQTTGLHEKKLKAEQDLQRILKTKTDFESKLRQLRASYDNEVKQVDQVDATLASAREETEALRSEASISEAKLNHLSGQLHEKQVECENLQKNNSALKEKLGLLNAEIADLEKQLESRTAENQGLYNQTSVKKSQVQVAIVKAEEYKNKISELEASNKRLQEEHDQAVEHEKALQAEHSTLATRESEASNFKPTSKSVSDSVQGTGHAAAAAVGAAAAGVAGVAGAVGSHFLSNDDSTKSDTRAETDTLKQDEHASAASEATSRDIDPQQQPKDVKPPAFSVSALVDEVKDKPTADMTGIDDHQAVEEPDSGPSNVSNAQDEKSGSEINRSRNVADLEGYPEISTNDHENATNQTATSSIATASYKHNEEGETPVTSPSNSDFQFPQGANAGVVGGLVGMPGVLVGVQRADSLTSSVQNNAALSVRDDNIDDMSDRDTIDNVVANSQTDGNSPPLSAQTHVERQAHGNHEDSSEGEKGSSGVGSFEIVNAEDAKGADNQYAPQSERSAPSETFVFRNINNEHAQNFGESNGSGNNDDEFPPIRELDYDESSSEDEGESQDNFDDANDNFQNQNHSSTAAATGSKDSVAKKEPAASDDFDSVFDGLKPATEEQDVAAKSPSTEKDLFADEFDDLAVAKPDTDLTDDFETNDDYGLSNDFTEGPARPAPSATSVADSIPLDKDNASNKNSENDEWEQLFAGFGNASPSKPAAEEAQETEQAPKNSTSTPQHSTGASNPVSKLDPSQEDAVQELVGMGFDEKTVLDALQKEGWNLEAATNYLLDHA